MRPSRLPCTPPGSHAPPSPPTTLVCLHTGSVAEFRVRLTRTELNLFRVCFPRLTRTELNLFRVCFARLTRTELNLFRVCLCEVKQAERIPLLVSPSTQCHTSVNVPHPQSSHTPHLFTPDNTRYPPTHTRPGSAKVPKRRGGRWRGRQPRPSLPPHSRTHSHPAPRA
eukprot:353371-Chlamydomonas_euryale.AAC.2